VPLVAKIGYNAMSRQELRRFDAVHVHDKYLESRFGFLGKPIFTIPHPVDQDVFRPYHRKESRFTVLYCGRPTWAKGFDIFLELAEEMKDHEIEFEWLGGNANYPNVKTLGFQYDPLGVANIIGKAHILIEPQRVNTMGRSAIEALASGTIVLLRANREIVGELPSVLLAQTKDEMKEKIVQLKKNWEESSLPSSASMPSPFDPFSLERVTDMYECMFEAVV
jgi:glycosyltransferase involved in cell wall biosynthesis